MSVYIGESGKFGLPHGLRPIHIFQKRKSNVNGPKADTRAVGASIPSLLDGPFPCSLWLTIVKFEHKFEIRLRKY